DDGVTLEHQLVAFAIQEDAPVPGNALSRGMLVADAGRAIGGDGVIPARVVSNLVERAQVFVEALAGQCGGHGSAVKIDLFAVAVVRPHADDVALVGDDIDQLELPVEAADSGVALAGLLPRLNGKTNRRRVGELKADDGMSYQRRAPVVDGKVNAGDTRDARGARLPARGVIGLGVVVAVADVVQRDLVAVDFRPGELRDVGLPVAFVARLDCEPPCENDSKTSCNYTH